MRTAREMLEFATKNHFGHNHLVLHNGIRHFNVIEKQLVAHENVSLAFLGKFKRENGEKVGLCAFAMTESKIIIGQKNYPSGEKAKQYSFERLTDIIERTWFMYGEIVFHFQDTTFSIVQDSTETKKTYRAILEYLDRLKKGTKDKQSPFDEVSEQIIKYKHLAEHGYITWEEFDAKKKKLLDI